MISFVRVTGMVNCFITYKAIQTPIMLHTLNFYFCFYFYFLFFIFYFLFFIFHLNFYGRRKVWWERLR